MKLKAWKRKWKACQRCPLGREAHNHVLYRGDIPCDMLLIGEAPGLSEDVLGEPFIGPAGKMLDLAIERAFDEPDLSPRICIANILCCLPHDGDRSFRKPKKEEVEQCKLHLEELEVIADPAVIVLLGKVAEENYSTEIPSITIPHPSTALRSYGFKRSYYLERMVQGLIRANRYVIGE